jgi:hypothetical protein
MVQVWSADAYPCNRERPIERTPPSPTGDEENLCSRVVACLARSAMTLPRFFRATCGALSVVVLFLSVIAIHAVAAATGAPGSRR